MSTQIAPVKPTQEKSVISFIPFGSKDEIKLSVEIIKRFVAVRTKSGQTCDDSQAMRFLMLCQAQRLNPFAGDAFLCGYDGKNGPVFSLITAHQSFLKRAEVSTEYEGMESGIIISGEDGKVEEREGDFKMPEENVVGGWARVYRKGRKPTYRRLAIAAMKPNYETPFWSAEKAPGQIVKCAEADALRATFPTLLGGLYTADEMPMAAVIDVGTVGNKLVTDAPESEVRKPVAQASDTASAASSSKTELEKVVLDAGYTFDHFQRWGVETGNVEYADSISLFDEIKEADAKRILRAKTGLLTGLAAVKTTVEL